MAKKVSRKEWVEEVEEMTSSLKCSAVAVQDKHRKDKWSHKWKRSKYLLLMLIMDAKERLLLIDKDSVMSAMVSVELTPQQFKSVPIAEVKEW